MKLVNDKCKIVFILILNLKHFQVSIFSSSSFTNDEVTIFSLHHRQSDDNDYPIDKIFYELIYEWVKLNAPLTIGFIWMILITYNVWFGENRLTTFFIFISFILSSRGEGWWWWWGW